MTASILMQIVAFGGVCGFTNDYTLSVFDSAAAVENAAVLEGLKNTRGGSVVSSYKPISCRCESSVYLPAANRCRFRLGTNKLSDRLYRWKTRYKAIFLTGT